MKFFIENEPNKIKRQLLLLYLFVVIFSLDFLGPIEFLFFKSKGLGLGDILLLNSIMSFSILILEVPTGYITDKIGRINSFLLTVLTMIGGYWLLIIGNTFYVYTIAHCLFGMGVSFFSGTDTAFLYDTLLTKKREKHFSFYLSRLSSMAEFSSGVAGIICGVIASLHLDNVVLGCFIAMIIALILPFIMSEPQINKNYELDSKSNTPDSVSSFLSNVSIINILFLCCAALFLTSTLLGVKYSQPVLENVGTPVFLFGVFWVISKFVGSAASWIAPKVIYKYGVQRVTVVCLFLPLLVFFAISLVNWSYIVFALLCLFPAIKNIGSIIINEKVNEVVSSEIRATMNSVVNMSFRLIYMIIAPLSGYLVESKNLTFTFYTIILTLCLLYTLIFIGYRYFSWRVSICIDRS